MVSARIYIEGGGDSKELHARCREGFRRLFERCGLAGHMPRLVACGGREATYGDFTTAHRNASEGDYVAMLIDSEDPMNDIEKAWEHLKLRDGWDCPEGANDEQVLLMVTCMETWIIVDHTTLCSHYDSRFEKLALPAMTIMESRHRETIQAALSSATQKCKNPYAKGKRSFELGGKLSPDELRKHLPSFVRCERILGNNL
jgi:hypothetical protein